MQHFSRKNTSLNGRLSSLDQRKQNKSVTEIEKFYFKTH